MEFSMRQFLGLCVVGFLATPAGGCGDGDTVVGGDYGVLTNLEGVFEVTGNTYNESQCDSPGDEDGDSEPYFEVYEDAAHLLLQMCDSQTGCGDGGSFYDLDWDYLVKPEDDSDFEGSLFVAVPDAPPDSRCSLNEIEGVIGETTDGVHVEIRIHMMRADLEGDACSQEAAEERAAEMTCATLRIIDAVRLP
jgi:hypothetical protein